MLREFKFLRRNSGKNLPAEEAENVPVNPKDLRSVPTEGDTTRAPLNAIQDPSQNPNPVQEQDSGPRSKIKIERTPTKGKRKSSDASFPVRTPEKYGAGHSARNRFGWFQKNEPTSNAAEQRDDVRVEVSNSSTQLSRGLGVGNGSMLNMTPRSARTVVRANSGYSESNSTQSTPTKSVSKPPNPGMAAMSGSRLTANGGARAGNFVALSKGVPISSGPSTIINTVEVPQFELKDDPSFWRDHNVQVLIRIRPLNAMEKSMHGYNRCLRQESAQSITWIGQPETRFTFDHVACESVGQETLFRMAGQPMVENCLSGYNSCMFAYGQTGSGKTYTMLGEIEELENEPSRNRGLTPRIFDFLFARIRAEEENHQDERLKYYCKCSFLEIYNEQITDLLDPSCTNLLLREDIKKGVYVENLSEFEVQTVSDILRLLAQGSSNRKVAATNMNRESSRSHSVFTCVIESRWEKDATANLRFARLNLVDLAGSERQKSSGAEGERLREAASINKSLSTLGHVIMVLVDVAHGKLKHVPYRDSRLTFLLQDSLGGNSKTMIIANVSPSICCAAETLNTLKFAQRAKLIQNNAVVNEDTSGDIIALQHQIRLLKEELLVLKREKVSRSLSFGTTASRDMAQMHEDGYTVMRHDVNQQMEDDVLSSKSKCIMRVSSKQLKCLETTLAGALRREQIAEASVKQLEAENEQLNRLVRQREEDARCIKMTLKFREDKIHRMESLLSGCTPADTYLLEENKALSDEIQLLRAKIDRNPEVTRFALENIRLLDQLRRFQDFYEEGEKEILLAEVSDLRDQVLQNLDKSCKNYSNTNFSATDQLNTTLEELENCRNNLQACLEENAKLRREIDDLHSRLYSIQHEKHDQDGSVTLEKEFFLEIPPSEPNAQKAAQEKRAKKNDETLTKHDEEVVHLQLELDILKVILKEERSANIQKEEMVMCMERDVNLAKEKALLISKECEALKNELNEAKSIIEALESQQILTINEINSLRNSMNNYVELLSEKDLEIISLKKQFCSQRLGDQPPVKYSESEDSPLQAKLKGMQESLEKARGLNLWYQTDQALQASNEEEMDDVRKQAEAETAEVIVSLQEELAALQQQVQDSTLKETQSKNGVLLKSQLKELQEKLFLTSSENQVLGSMLEEKNLELQTLSEEWEQLTSDIYEILVNGHEALEDGSNRLNVISSSFPQSRTWISEQFIRMSWLITEKELVIEELNHCLENVSNSRNDLDCMLRSLKGAATVISEAHQQECSEKENQILMLLSDLSGKTSTIEKLENKLKLVVDYSVRTSHCATAALVIVNRLSDNTNHLKVQKDKDIQLSEAVETNLKKDALLHDQTLTIEEADKQIQNLTMQLEMLEETCAKLRFELLEEQKHVHDLEQKLEGVEENDNILKKTNLDELKSGISMLRLYMTKCVAQLGSREEKTCQSYDCGSASCSSATDSKTNQITKNTHLDLLTSFPNELKCTLEAGKSVCTSAGMSADACDIATSTFVRKEIESFTESFKQVQGEMTGLRYEKEEIRMFEKQSQENMKSLMAEALVLQSAMNSFEKLHRLQLMALDNKLQMVERAVQKVNTNWSQMKEVLEQEVGDAKIVAAQTAAEASCILGKFEESQETVKEADFMINKLLIANEAMKLEIEKLKTTKITLTDERDALAREVHGLESAYIIKDIQCQEFEKQLVLNLMDTNDLVLELEAFSVHVQASLMKELMSISHEFHCMKSQLVESTKSLRSWLEDIWSESIIKDCSVSVLHLCHMGIMLETVTGLNAENGFLHHGLCESNSVIADLRKRNVRSRKELEMCRIVEGKLLADIKNSFDRITRKEDETGELGIKLTAFEKKITDLQLQEELMLQRSNYMGSQLATLVRELDMSNANALASLLDQEKLMKDKEIMKSETELYIRDLLYNDFQSVIVASRLEEMAVQNAKKEREQIYFSAVLENLQKELIFGGMDAGVKELLSMEKEVEVSLLQSDRQDLLSDLNKSRSNALEMDRVNMGLQNDLDLLKDVACSNQRLEDELSDAVEAKARLSNQVQNLESEYEKLVKEIKMNKMEFDVQNEKLLYNDFQSVIVASQLEEMAVQNAKKEREQIYFSAVLENLQKELIFGSIDAGVKELLLVEKEVEVSLLQSCRQDLLSDLNQSRSNALEMGKVNMGLQNDLDLLKDVACSNQRLEDELSEAVEAKARLSNQVQNLESEYEKLVKEMQMNKMESDVQNEKLQNKICLLEASYSTLQNDMTRSDEKVSRMSCLEAENKSLEDEIAKFEAENHILLQDLVEMKNEVESFLCHFNALSLDRHGLQEKDTSLKTCVASLRTGLDMREAELTELRDQQFALQEELCLKSQDLDIHYNRLNVLIEENASLKSELRSHAKNMHEVLMSLSLNNTKCAGKVNTVHMDTNQTLNVLNEECFTLLDKLLEEGCENLNKASKFIEEFEYFEKFVEELVSRNLLLQTELSRKDEILKGLSFDLRLLQESASNAKDQKDEFDNMASSLEVLEDELALKSGQLVEAVDHGHFLEARLQETLDTIASLELEISNKKERIDVLSFDNQELIAEVKDASAAKQTVQEELTDKRNINDRLELDLISMGNSLEQMHTSIESLNRDLNAVSVERDHLQAEVLILKKELDEAQTRAVESEAIIADAQQMAEARSIYAEEKDKEVKLLEKSVEELECTIDVLESKVDIVKGEAERQRLQREELELELHALKLQLKNVESSDADFKRLLHEKEDNVLGAQKRIQILEREIATRDAEISQCKAHISELYLHAEVQATEYKQKFKALEAMADQVRPEGTAFHVATSSTNKLERNSSKSRGSGSPFKCIGLGLAHQIKSEKDEELTAGRHRIEELEALAASRQKEIFTLNARLAAAESMTHDVIRDLLGVKLDMTNYVSLLNNQQLQKMTDKALIQSTETQAKEQEAHMLRQQLNELIVERQGWLEEINRKQAEMVTLQVSLEELHQRDHLLVAENEMLKVENINQKKKVIELESAIQKLSGQQNLQQRIRHHAKIKEENNLLKIRNEDLGVKLQRAEAILSRVKEELAHYRAANGRCPSIDFDEEQKLHVKLKETEKERLQLEQKLLGLCTSILKAAGITKVIHDVGLPEAEEALNQLNNRVLSLEKEMQDLKLMDRIASEKIRLSELMPQASRLSSGTQDGQQVSKTGSQTPFLSALDR